MHKGCLISLFSEDYKRNNTVKISNGASGGGGEGVWVTVFMRGQRGVKGQICASVTVHRYVVAQVVTKPGKRHTFKTMLAQRWPSVADGGPTLSQRSFSGSVFTGMEQQITHATRRTLSQCWYNIDPPSSTLANINPTLLRPCLAFSGYTLKWQVLYLLCATHKYNHFY